jgi:D-inositol-3-phosphate glycosyltransferase
MKIALVSEHAPDALAKRLARLALDPALGERMGAAGLERALARFTWARVARIIESVYRRVSHVPAENARDQDDDRSRRQAAFQAVRAAAGRM